MCWATPAIRRNSGARRTCRRCVWRWTRLWPRSRPIRRRRRRPRLVLSPQLVPAVEFVGDAAVDEQAPYRLGDRFRKAGLAGLGFHLGDHILDPGLVEDRLAVGF